VREKQWEEKKKGGGLYNDGHKWLMHMLHHSGIEKVPFNAVKVSFGTKGLIRMQACAYIPIVTVGFIIGCWGYKLDREDSVS
jgi:hypothetical protein